MTPTEAFEAWWKKYGTWNLGHDQYYSNDIKQLVIAACEWQREQDARIAEAYHSPKISWSTEPGCYVSASEGQECDAIEGIDDAIRKQDA